MTEILNLDYFAFDRDMHIMTPIRVYLEKKRNVKITVGNIYNTYFLVFIKRPKLILIANAHGDELVHNFIKFLYNIGFNIVNVNSEGNFHDEYQKTYIWGWNNDFKLYHDKMILWNEDSKRITLKYYPYLLDKLSVSGATGFDRFFLFDYSKGTLKKKYNLTKNDKIIGIASFGSFKTINNVDYYYNNNPDYPKSNYELFIEDYPKIKKIYFDLINNNPSILFILRVHPEFVNDFKASEFADCLELDNVLISSTIGYIPDIAEVIGLSDIWIGYESTTSMEAWLLNKFVLYINPTRSDFMREDHHKGLIICKTTNELQNYINKHYKDEKIKEYDDLESIREKIIKRVLGYMDAKSHERAGEIIYKELKKAKRPPFIYTTYKLIRKINWIFILRFYVHRTKWYFKLRPNLQKPFWAIINEKEVYQRYRKIYNEFIK
ncbi:MAG: BFO_1060 family glycosyltransferase [Bacteroidia bacterium]